MEKKLEIGSDYGFVFGLDHIKGQGMIYLGGVKFRAENGTASRDIESQGTYDKVHEYINRTSIHMGRM